MEAGKTARKESAETEAVPRRLDAETDERRNLRLTDGQTVDAGIRGERLNRPKVGRLYFAVIAGDVFHARVVPVTVAVCGGVLTDAKDVGELHAVIFQRRLQEVPRI
ncbi:hypothetical protein [Streptomyces sp. NPDC005828]|uniref:hypothetical protein n=1 Tax=Streptomyces sp. NPDC005828 TaxID=3157071 RepID=UPI0033C49884